MVSVQLLLRKLRIPIFIISILLLISLSSLSISLGIDFWKKCFFSSIYIGVGVFYTKKKAAVESEFEFLLNVALNGVWLAHSVNGGLLWCFFEEKSFLVRVLLVILFKSLLLSSFTYVFGFVNPRMRSKTYLALVTFPATFCFSSAILSIATLPLVALSLFLFNFQSPIVLILLSLPFLLSLLGMYESLIDSAWVNVKKSVLNNGNEKDFELPVRVPSVARVFPLSHNNNVKSTDNGKQTDCLRIIQLTDIHIGAFYSTKTLAQLCRTIVELDPDIVALTGDYYTPEGDHEPHSLATGLAPLKQLRGRVVACLGNHDKESSRVLRQVREDLRACDIQLLVDETTLIDTRLGTVDVLGLDWRPGGVHKHINDVVERTRYHVQQDDTILKLILLHAPECFKHIPKMPIESLTLSGHTHGGQGIYILLINV